MADDIVKEAREAMEMSHEADRDNRREAMTDLRFRANFQWTPEEIAERKGRPMITINKTDQFVRQVANPIRQNMPTIKVEPDGDDDSQMAEVANGLFRRIQYNSSASHVYAAAVEHMVTCGIGWFRVVNDYADEESFHQELMIKRIFDPLSVYPDPGAMEPDRSDMNWCLISSMIPRKAFEAKYKGKSVNGMDTPSTGTGGVDWGGSDTVRVAEYWRRKETKRTLARLSDGQTVDLTALGEAKAGRIMSIPGLVIGTRAAKGYKVEMTLVSGSEVLDDAYECPCKWIPIIPVIGAEIPLENGVYRHGLIRFEREPARLQNYFLSVAAESLGQQPKTPYLATAKQIAKYKNLWDNANVEPTPYLLYEPDAAAGGPPQRVAPPPLPTALIQMAQMMADNSKAVTGQYDASLGARSNETSGVAIQGRIEQGNQATFHFVDNLQHSLEHTGRVLLDMIPKVYDTARALRMTGEDGTENVAHINTPTVAEDGEPVMVNDLSQMSFSSVRVVMGPSYASRRQEAVQNLTNLVQALPQIGQVGADIIVRNMDFEGAEKLAERLKAVLPPQILQLENPEEAQAQEAPPQDPLAEAQMQSQAAVMESEVTSSQAKAEQEKAKVQFERHRADGAQIDNALKMKKLREPTPRPSHGFDGYSAPAE